MKKKLYLAYAAIIFAPVLVNYCLFTWKAPYVFGDPNSWLSFFANYLGFIGAFFIALFQFRIQKERDRKNDLESNRSFIIAHDFSAPANLKNVRTHEDSIIIETLKYKEYLERLPKSKHDSTMIPFYKIFHRGSPDIILDCEISIDSESEDGKIPNSISTHVGVIQKGIEVFIPLINKDIGIIKLKKLTVDYTTIKGERIRYVQDLLNQKESHSIIHKDGNIETLFEFNLFGTSWIYPRKLES